MVENEWNIIDTKKSNQTVLQGIDEKIYMFKIILIKKRPKRRIKLPYFKDIRTLVNVNSYSKVQRNIIKRRMAIAKRHSQLIKLILQHPEVSRTFLPICYSQGKIGSK